MVKSGQEADVFVVKRNQVMGVLPLLLQTTLSPKEEEALKLLNTPSKLIAKADEQSVPCDRADEGTESNKIKFITWIFIRYLGLPEINTDVLRLQTQKGSKLQIDVFTLYLFVSLRCIKLSGEAQPRASPDKK